ncbi:TetR/AcrR family transcriptional regulator [Actinokineospora enzanensis]|uniref:TetR/AcrR family transcriptional regulator n=1 Tax=Actinokineospora enzanensis TaxID=155975 RepID=UPI000373B0E8|nr:TetR/AcrR family transcriptional regulator [Actinokineospora enzanensis]
MTSDTRPEHRPLRADAERNRTRLVHAAREVFATHGLSVTLDDVARHAGVGVGTVYRRFPNKDALVSAVFDQLLGEILDLIDTIAADPDPWHGITCLITEIVERQTANRGLYEICTNEDFGRMRQIAEHFEPAVDSLVLRAQAQGTLRADFESTDLGPLIIMLTTAADLTRSIDPNLWRRYLCLVLDGLRAPGNCALPAAELTHERLSTAMREFRFK